MPEMVSNAFTILTLSSAEDFCKSKLCQPGVTHIACNNTGNLSPSCLSKNANFINLEPWKAQILKFHNEKRNEVAGGKIPNHLPAVRMATMQWDDDLAYMAGLTVKKCDYGSNYCINTNKYRISGENWAKHYWYGFSETISSLLESQMTSWFDKYKLSNMNFINNMSSVQNGPYTFTVMVHQLSTRIGCAAVRYSEVNNGINWSTLTTACSYAHNNVLGHKVYVSGPVASKCVTGRNKDFLNLCSVDEVYDVNIPL